MDFGDRVALYSHTRERGAGDVVEIHHALGRRPHGRRLADGRARHAGRLYGAEPDPPRSRRVDRAARVDGQRVQPELRRPADHRRGARRPLRAPPALRRRPGAVRRRLGGERARPDVGWLIAARAVQGAGSALIMPLGLALLSAAFPAERRSAAIGIFSAITGLAVAAGPLVGGAVVEGINWQWIFWLNVPIGLLAIPLVLTKMKESFGPDTGLDLGGLALITTGALGLVWGLMRGNQVGWGSVEVVTSLAAGAALLAGFVAWEVRAREPMLPIRFFRSRSFSAGNTAIFFTFASLFGAVFFYAQLLQVGYGYGRWMPDCGCFRGRRRSLPWRRSRVRWPTGSAIAR